MTKHAALVDALWSARTNGGIVDAVELTPEEGAAVLAQLVRRTLDAGDEVAGWKVGRIPTADGTPLTFAAPVFASTRVERWDASSARAPRVELELVAAIDGSGRELERADGSWRVALELVDNHDPAWTTNPGWAIADWGLHARGVVGDACRAPEPGETLAITLRAGDDEQTHEGTFRYDTAEVAAVVTRTGEALGRPYRSGEPVWTGWLVPPFDVAAGTPVEAEVAGFGAVTLAGA